MLLVGRAILDHATLKLTESYIIIRKMVHYGQSPWAGASRAIGFGIVRSMI
jgi:hypothetical protein